MACSEEIVKFATEILPDYACLVPENRREVTTEGGVNLLDPDIKDRTARAVETLSKKGIICSIFIDPEAEQIRVAAEIGAPHGRIRKRVGQR